VLHVTTHIGLLDAIAKIEPGLVERTIARVTKLWSKPALRIRESECAESIRMPGEWVIWRGEEETKIQPAIDVCRKKGWNVEGPLPATPCSIGRSAAI